MTSLGPGNELRKLARSLESAADGAPNRIKPVVKKAAQNIKTAWQENLRESSNFGQIATTVGYDDESGDDNIRFVIGTTPSPHVYPKRKRGEGVAKDSGGLIGIALGYTSRGGGHRIDPIEIMEAEAENLDLYLGRVLDELFFQGL